MRFTTAKLVEEVVWQMRQTDLPRGENRALIDKLANGDKPMTEAEATAAGLDVNVNFLDLSKISAEARRTYEGALQKQNRFFTVNVDYGPPNKKTEWGQIISKELNRIMKNSGSYYELLRSQFALTVLHGIGPAYWRTQDYWCPECVGIEDVLIPSNTLISMQNLNHFAVFRQYTPMELYKLTHGPKVDPAWNMPVVEAALNWADSQTQSQLAYSELYAPQKVEERWHQDLGFYGTDSVPTVDCWDFYFWSDEEKEAGWRRRMILDTPAIYEINGRKVKMPDKTKIGREHNEWLYCPDDKRVYADKRENIIHFQFGDASSVAPFRYHSVRGLGWLLYAVCHLQNRMRCKLSDAVFENLLQYFRVGSESDREKVTKIDLHNFGVIPQDVQFVQQNERWQVNTPLTELGMNLNRQSMIEVASQYREGRDTDRTAGQEKTATQVMAEVNAANALISSMLLQAYQYCKFQYNEIVRRFCRKNSLDPDVREFRKCVLKKGVPEQAIDFCYWDIDVEKVIGSGNQILAVAMADKLMATLPLHDPESQREILHIHDSVVTTDPELADRLVPMNQKRVGETVQHALGMIGTLMQGIPIPPSGGLNPIEMVETLMHGLAAILKRIQETQQVPTPSDMIGLANLQGTIEQWIQIVSANKDEAQRAKQYQKDLDELRSIVEGFAGAMSQEQPQGEQAAAQDPKDAAKAQAMIIQAQTKAKLAEQSHAQKTAQRERQFQSKMRQDEQKHRAEMGKKMLDAHTDVAKTDLLTAAEIRRNRLKATQETKDESKD